VFDKTQSRTVSSMKKSLETPRTDGGSGGRRRGQNEPQ
jgi:hypothetical protein